MENVYSIALQQLGQIHSINTESAQLHVHGQLEEQKVMDIITQENVYRFVQILILGK